MGTGCTTRVMGNDGGIGDPAVQGVCGMPDLTAMMLEGGLSGWGSGWEVCGVLWHAGHFNRSGVRGCAGCALILLSLLILPAI